MKKNIIIRSLILIGVFLIFCFIIFFRAKDYLTQEKKIPEKNVISINNSKSNTNNTISKTTKSSLVLNSVGDCTIGSDSKSNRSLNLPAYVEKKDLSYLFKNVSDVFNKDDITSANLETTFTDSNKKAEKKYNFKAPPNYVDSLKLGHIDVVNISNNHIYDYLDTGFTDTLNALKKSNIGYFGEGNILIKNIKGHKIGFLGYKGFYYDYNSLNKIRDDITNLKSKGCSPIVINFHWGSEGSYYPNKTQKYLAHYAIDSGADLIIGHHPHVIQGIEKYKNRIICYSLGNFCFGGNINPKDKDTFIVQTKFNFSNNKLDSYDIKAIPCRISSVTYKNDYSPVILSGDEKDKILSKLNRLSSQWEIKLNDNFYHIGFND